jgi:hypothetical protein
MNTITGFNAYWAYVAIKIHFGSSYNIAQGLPAKSKLISCWNSERVKKDGKLFLAVENRIQDLEQLVRCCSYYYYQNNNYYVIDILEDKFKLYDKLELNYENIENCFINDLHKIQDYCNKNGKIFSEIIGVNNKIPLIYNLGLSPFSMVILNGIFKFTDNDKVVNALQKNKYRNMKNTIDKFSQLYHNRIYEYDWKTILKEYL